ncbi:MAG: hypothetical protein J7K23_07620 [Thermoproteales archaeon]|nr:hypothetical protein [Thermoproteales archaeon]
MKKIGKVIVITRNNNAIVRIKRKLHLGSKVYDEKMRIIGFIYDIIGPVKKPYAVIKIDSSKITPNSLTGKTLFIENERRWKKR